MHSKVMRFLALVILLGMVTPQTGSAQIDDLSALDRQFHQLDRQGYYAKAARIAKRAAGLAGKKNRPRPPECCHRAQQPCRDVPGAGPLRRLPPTNRSCAEASRLLWPELQMVLRRYPPQLRELALEPSFGHLTIRHPFLMHT
jgi:hypothetical protein